MNLEAFINVTISHIAQFDFSALVCDTFETFSSATATISLRIARGIVSLLSAANRTCGGGDSLIEFSDIQTTLLSIFLAIFFANLALIAFYWNKYGGVITDRFVRPSMIHNIFSSLSKFKS